MSPVSGLSGASSSRAFCERTASYDSCTAARAASAACCSSRLQCAAYISNCIHSALEYDSCHDFGWFLVFVIGQCHDFLRNNYCEKGHILSTILSNPVLKENVIPRTWYVWNSQFWGYSVLSTPEPVRVAQCPSSCVLSSWAGAARALIRGRKEGLRRIIYTMQRAGSAKRRTSSGPIVRSVAFRQTCPQSRRPVLPHESWRSYESSVATAGYPTDDRGRSRLRIHAPWPE